MQRLPLRFKTAWNACRRGVPLLIDLLLPPSCPFCGAESVDDAAGLLCGECRARMANSTHIACGRCGMFGRQPQARKDGLHTCSDCRNRKYRFQAVFPPLGAYRGELRQAVIRMKKPHERPLVWAIGKLWGNHLTSQVEKLPDLLTPVPRHWWRRIQTQQDVPLQLAECLGIYFTQTTVRPLLSLHRMTQKQSHLARNARSVNLHQAMSVKNPSDICGRSVAVVDDIMTTGATLNEAARALLAAGAASVTAMVVARAMPGDNSMTPASR